MNTEGFTTLREHPIFDVTADGYTSTFDMSASFEVSDNYGERLTSYLQVLHSVIRETGRATMGNVKRRTAHCCIRSQQKISYLSQEPTTPILGLRNGIFTDQAIFWRVHK